MRLYPFIEAEKPQGSNVNRACERLKVSRSAFYAARGDGPSSREWEDVELAAQVKTVHEERPRGASVSLYCAARSLSADR